MSFYITLPSNGSQKYFPENRIANYKIKLPYKLKTPAEDFELALTEFSYICSIQSLTGNGNDNLIRISGQKNGVIHLPLIHYKNIHHLMHEINNSFEKLEIPCAILHSMVKPRICLQVGGGYKIKFSTKLSEIIGFDGKTEFSADVLQKESALFYSKFRPDIHGGRYHMFIYCDIVESQIVGSSMVPLLRMVNITGEEGKAVTQTFSCPFYLPVSRSEFDVISIILCDEFGIEIPIDKGQVTLTLHFREKTTKNGQFHRI